MTTRNNTEVDKFTERKLATVTLFTEKKWNGAFSGSEILWGRMPVSQECPAAFHHSTFRAAPSVGGMRRRRRMKRRRLRGTDTSDLERSISIKQIKSRKSLRWCRHSALSFPPRRSEWRKFGDHLSNSVSAPSLANEIFQLFLMTSLSWKQKGKSLIIRAMKVSWIYIYIYLYLVTFS